MTIRKQLTLWYAGLLITIIVLFGAITFFVVRITMIDNLDDTLRESANQIMVNSRLVAIPEFGADPRVDVQLASLDVFRASNVYVQAWEIVDGDPEFKGASANLNSLGSIALDHQALGVEADEHFANVTIQDVELRVLTKPIILGDRLVGNVQVAGDLATVNQALDTLLLIMVISCAIAIFGAGVLSMWFSHRALKPIEDITDAAGNIAVSNDLSTRLGWKGPQDELGRLVSVFNHMMSRIEHTFGVQQRFVADMSHELRTPLTAIKGNLELAQRYGMQDDMMDDINIETERMSRLVNDLLMLARADYGGIVIDMAMTDLDLVVRESFNQAKLLLDDRDLTLKLGNVTPIVINGNSNRIKQLILNVMSNAIKFTDDGGEISIALNRDGDYAVISVRDNGIGIASEEIERIFDRFYQIDQSRVRLHDSEGFGLGLSVAKWIIEAHNGVITVDSTPEKGTQVNMRFPVHIETQDIALQPHKQVTRTRIPILRRGQNQFDADAHDSHSSSAASVRRSLRELEIIRKKSDSENKPTDHYNTVSVNNTWDHF